MAEVKIAVEGVECTLDVSVADNVRVSVLLRRDVPKVVNIGKAR